MLVCKRCWFRASSGGGRRAGPTPLVELIREDEALGVLQRGVFSLVSQEVAQLCGGQHAAVTGIVPEYAVEFRPPQQLPAELLDLYVVQTIVSGSVTPLGCVDGLGWGRKRHTYQTKRAFVLRKMSMQITSSCVFYIKSPVLRGTRPGNRISEEHQFNLGYRNGGGGLLQVQ